MISWDKRQAGDLHLVIESADGGKTFPLDREKGTMIVATPAPPYRIGYRAADTSLITIASAGLLPVKTAQVRLPFNSGAERAELVAPPLPLHLKPALRGTRKEVELFIKVNPEGKVTGTSSPYYPDALRRELARLASDTAMLQWRFKPAKRDAYRDSRVQLSFDSTGARIRAY